MLIYTNIFLCIYSPFCKCIQIDDNKFKIEAAGRKYDLNSDNMSDYWHQQLTTLHEIPAFVRPRKEDNAAMVIGFYADEPEMKAVSPPQVRIMAMILYSNHESANCMLYKCMFSLVSSNAVCH